MLMRPKKHVACFWGPRIKEGKQGNSLLLCYGVRGGSACTHKKHAGDSGDPSRTKKSMHIR